MTWKTLVSRGDPVKANRHYTIYLYPNKYSDIDTCEGPVLTGGDNSDNGGLEHLCSQLYSGNVVDYYEIVRYTDSKPQCSTDSYADFKSEFSPWVRDRYGDYAGTHLGISTEITGGRADSSNHPSHCSAFIHCKTGVAGAGYSNDNRTAQVAVHESLHTITNRGLDDVDEMIDNDSDHDLGHLFMIGHEKGAGSPLLGGYGSEHWAHGDCDAGIATKEEYWTRMNSCEETATDVTADHDYSQGSCD